MTRSLTFEWTRCGFGTTGGLYPGIRLGWLHIWTYRGSIYATLLRQNRALTEAETELRRPVEPINTAPPDRGPRLPIDE